ncbi:hypothetical protein ABK864_03570 [Serratia marcescens]|uniref:hypothetical protein n=1 Tax=Serratia TaxID=613 RepID=UPI00313E907D
MWLMKTLLTSVCINQRGAGHPISMTPLEKSWFLSHFINAWMFRKRSPLFLSETPISVHFIRRIRVPQLSLGFPTKINNTQSYNLLTGKEKMKLIYVTLTEMGQRYGYTLNGVKSWIKEGLPFDDEKKKIPEKTGTQWILENKINPMKEISVKEEMDKEKLREQKAKADLAQMQAAKEAGYLIETDLVQGALDSYVANFKDIVRAIPRNYALEIMTHSDDQNNLKNKLTEICNQVLNEIGDLMVDKSAADDLIESPEIELLQRPTENESDNESNDKWLTINGQ